ncbi:MAG TPA: threonine-phosphate decarboxylase CobD [Xanthobacteraceae bacterium]|nr:threonine-phosphate decarboxylase CobD [Xanthobacteraceae bacterium]
MIPYAGKDEPVVHGGDLGAARRLFPSAPEPFIDLSTGINPNPYPLPHFPAELFARLPEPSAARELAAVAARAYRAPSPAHVVPAPGTQILLPLVAALVRPGRAAVLTPTYGEFARAAALAGHRARLVRAIEDCSDADLAMVANPNNPDGRLLSREALLALAEALRRRGGVLAVDEAYMDVGPAGASLAPEVLRGNVVVLRSLGKFFGLAGMRLGFALAAPALAARLGSVLGPWAVSGPALAVGAKALADTDWIESTRSLLANKVQRLDAMLGGSGLNIVGGTGLFRLVRTLKAGALFRHLGRAGIFVRTFPDNASWLRFGLPADEQGWQRLEAAMASFPGGE